MNGILLANRFAEGKTTIIVASKNVDLEKYGITPQERAFINASLDKKHFTITLNRFNYWLIFQFTEDKKTEFAINESLRIAAFKLHDFLVKQKIGSIQIIDAAKNGSQTLAFSEGLFLSNYQFIKYLSDRSDKKFSLEEISIVSTSISKKQVEDLNYVLAAVYFARDLVNEPASFLTSQQLSREIEKIGQEAGFDVETLHKSQIEMLKMGGLLAVNKGSSEPPTFTIMEWKPANAVNKKPYVLVGKGVVYDSGGLSLKPTADSMDYMKCDMAGAATVTGTIYALAKANIPVYVIGLVPSTDNRLDALSYSPGDIITMYNGATVEVLNTDAEGRLILADALSYAKQFDPALVISVATLTGAAHRAIGEVGIVGMGNADSTIFQQLETSGWNVYERVAELPFWDEYGEIGRAHV